MYGLAVAVLAGAALRRGMVPMQASMQGCQILARLMSSSEQDTRDPHWRAERFANGETFQLAVATLKRTAGTCAERAPYLVNLYSDRVSFGYVDAWSTFSADASGAFGDSFTVRMKPHPLDFKLFGQPQELHRQYRKPLPEMRLGRKTQLTAWRTGYLWATSML
jgi:hypothetical protein